MKNNNENQFINKFRYLHSQEMSEDISWSCSDSSDYEYSNKQCRTLSNITNEIRRKRKRVNNRKKERNNISNLDITILDTSSERNNSIISAKSPILVGKPRSNEPHKSYNLTPSQLASKVTNHKALTNLNQKSSTYTHVSTAKEVITSPVIHVKNNSWKVSQNVRKKLFNGDKYDSKSNEDIGCERSTSPILSKKKDYLDRRKCIYPSNNIVDSVKEAKKKNINHQMNYNMTHDINECLVNDESIQSSSSEESGPKQSHTTMVAKVKSYFDNYFVSEGSQPSISDCETLTPRNSSKSSNEIDIVTPRTQETNEVSLSTMLTTNKFENHTNVPKKKVKFKKGGLAYRLNTLLKKQNSSITLWQHERFLAENSNFVLPKEEFLAFRIKNVHFKYGIYLLEIVNGDNEFFTVSINSQYVNNKAFEIDGILKIYEPFKIVDSDNCKIICNVCKFECERLIT